MEYAIYVRQDWREPERLAIAGGTDLDGCLKVAADMSVTRPELEYVAVFDQADARPVAMFCHGVELDEAKAAFARNWPGTEQTPRLARAAQDRYVAGVVTGQLPPLPLAG